MRKKKLFLAFTLIFFLPFLSLANKKNAQDIFKQAEKNYNEQSYKPALSYYQDYIKDFPKEKNTAEAKIKITICYYKLRQYSESEAFGIKALPSLKGIIWEARLYRIMGQNRFTKPHYGYRKNGKITWGRYVQGGRYVRTQGKDQIKAVQWLEKARTLYMAQVERKANAKKLPVYGVEWIGVDVELARIIDQWRSRYYWSYSHQQRAGKKFLDKMPKEYSPKFNKEEKILYLYTEALGLSKKQKLNQTAAKILYKKGMYLLRSGRFQNRVPSKKLHPKLHPEPVFRQFLTQYPKDKLVPAVLLVLGKMMENKQDFLTAKDLYKRIIKSHPKAVWASDAQYYIRQMERERLSFSSPKVYLPGQKPQLSLRLRNIGKLNFKITTFALARFLNSHSQNYNYKKIFGQINSYPLSEIQAYGDREIHSSTLDTKDKKDHRYLSFPLEIPVKKVGAYLVEIWGQFVHTYQIVIISDLTLVEKIDRKQVILYVADSFTGKPVAGAEVSIKERFTTYRPYRYRVDTKRGTTDDHGLATKMLARPQRSYGSSISAVAWVGQRYALSGYGYGSYYNSNTRIKHQFYCLTDRPVYRPTHKVNFKIYLRRNEKGQYFNEPSRKVLVRIRSPRGKEIYKKLLTTNENGAVWGSVKLKKKTDLGMYYIYARLRGSRYYQYSQGNRFRVEEYKKPEYEVKIQAPTEQVRLGQKIKIKVKAIYYFGSPVANAKVTYRVFRSTYNHSYYPAGSWDWLYGRGYGIRYLDNYYNWGWNNWYYYRNYRSSYRRELTLQGKGTTNDNGELEFVLDTSRFKTDKKLNKWDHQFTIEANVVDASRRSIKGSSSVNVTRKSFYAYIFSRRGFYTKGDKASFTLTALSASNNPIQTSGILKIYKVTYTGKKNKKEVLTLVKSQPLKTDHKGKGFFTYKSDETGKFRMVFEAKDKWDQKVQGVRDVWFAGSDFTGNHFKFGSLEILTDKRHYEEGETAHLMINTSQMGAGILLCQEVNREITNYQVITPKGKSAVVDLKITSAHTPNFFLSAISIHGGKVHRQSRQVFVPPIKHLLKVKLTASKAHYRPGEKAKISVQTTDYKGKPLSAPVALSVVDQSVFYIQSDLTPDVRKYYYGSLRGNSVRTYTSYSFSSSSKTWDPQPNYRKIYPTHGMPPGWYSRGGYLQAGKQDIYSMDLSMDSERGKGGIGGGRSGGLFKSKRAPASPSGARRMRSRLSEKKEMDRSPKADSTSSSSTVNQALKKPRVRKNFADTAYWNPSVVTNDKGKATVEFTLPDSLTSWRISAKAIDSKTSVGQVVAHTITRKNLLIRLQAPRFFTEKDEVILSGIVHNYLKTAKEVTCKIKLGGGVLKLLGKKEIKIKIKPQGVYRVDWKVQVIREGTAAITMMALTNEESDAQQMKFPAYVHGIMKYVANGGSIEPGATTATINLKVPKERKVDSTKLQVVLTPSLASAMLDALPYLSAYPYGCVEQTMSRFLPSVVTAAILKDLKLNLEQIGEKRKELHAKYLASRPWMRYRSSGTTFSSKELQRRVVMGLYRLYSFQHSDGGWGWWRGGYSDTYMTAYVTYGLYTAKKAGHSVESGVLARATSYLKNKIGSLKTIHQKAYVLFVLSQMQKASDKELALVFKKRGRLNLYSKALLALSLHNMGKKKASQVVCRNIMDMAKEDKSNGTAWFETEQNYWWYWYNNDIETNAFALKALSNIDPKNPILPKLVKWLLRNREGMRWRSTKTTAFVIYAMADYIKASGELSPDYTITVKYQNKVVKKVKVTGKNALFFDNQIVLTGKEIPAGATKLVIEKVGKGRLYYSAYLEFFTKEEGVKGAGNEIFVKRTYTKLIKKVVKRKVGNRMAQFIEYDRVPLKDGAQLVSGDLVEVKLSIEAKNDYEYLMFEDRKPAGLEAVALKSGYSYAGGLCSNMELRDEKVVFFVSWLQQGKHEITYKLRAEIPGTFHALPAYGEAMYAPKVKAISDEWRVSVQDKGAEKKNQ